MLFAGSIRYVPENIICIEIVPHELLGINFLDRTLVCVRNRPERFAYNVVQLGILLMLTD